MTEEETAVTVAVTKETEAKLPYGAKYYETLETLPEDLKPVFRKMVDDYTFVASMLVKWRWAAYAVLAEMVKGGWRPSEKAVPACLLKSSESENP